MDSDEQRLSYGSDGLFKITPIGSTPDQVHLLIEFVSFKQQNIFLFSSHCSLH